MNGIDKFTYTCPICKTEIKIGLSQELVGAIQQEKITCPICAANIKNPVTEISKAVASYNKALADLNELATQYPVQFGNL